LEYDLSNKISNNIIQPITNVVRSAVSPLVDYIKPATAFLQERILQPATTIINNIAQSIGNNIAAGINNIKANVIQPVLQGIVSSANRILDTARTNITREAKLIDTLLSSLPYSGVPSFVFPGTDYSPFYQSQGDTPHCADFSISMVCNIYTSASGIPGEKCGVGNVSSIIDSLQGLGRFGDGSTTPIGINATLNKLGIPYLFSPY
jgi:hypothetical protein